MQILNFKGKTTKELLNIDIKDFNALSRSDLSKLVSRIGDTANKRLKRLEKIETPAKRQMERGGGKISSKEKSLNELRAEFMRAKNFLLAETSTIKGYNEYKQDVIRQLKIEGVDDLTDKQFEKLWKTYEILKETSPEVSSKKFKYVVIPEIAGEIISAGRVSAKAIAERIQKRLTYVYERKFQNSTDVSQFFEFE